jgi:Lrp/AsnC family transcriptional regulator, leucine-responsive regulatory protein
MSTMNSIDARLLELLQRDCSQSLAELGSRVGLSISAVNERLKKLRARGHVRAYVALVNPQTLGYAACAFVLVAVEGKKNEKAFVEAVLKIPQIEECHYISGEFPYLLKIWAHDVQDLERLNERIKELAGVLRTQVSVVLSSAKDHVTGLVARSE